MSKKRVLLLNPSFPTKLLPGFPIGLAYLSALLKKEGKDVHTLDAAVDNLALEYLALVKKNKK